MPHARVAQTARSDWSAVSDVLIESHRRRAPVAADVDHDRQVAGGIPPFSPVARSVPPLSEVRGASPGADRLVPITPTRGAPEAIRVTRGPRRRRAPGQEGGGQQVETGPSDQIGGVRLAVQIDAVGSTLSPSLSPH